ncbi:hypothetical protein [Gemmatimonas aurantiaca]|uniref:hypothetical protein n=1 Tax=Gemmatimonas aurantiaca TaxID=173480 RepID=UPI00301C00C0
MLYPQQAEAYHQAYAEAAAEARGAGVYDDADALASSSPLFRALAVLDARVGKRRLRQLAATPDEHPLVRRLRVLRCEAEGIRLPPAAI